MLQNKRFYLALIRLALLFALTAQSAFAQQASNIASSKHNFAAGGTNLIKSAPLASGGTSQICVFCHTPHGATSLAYAPLWNKVFSTSTTYTLYTSDYLTALGYPAAAQPKVKSRLCLSCHDGTVALGSVYNLPGSGTGAGTIPMQTGTTAITFMPTTAAGHLGTNLADDHPVGYSYLPGSAAGQDPELVVRAWPWPTTTTGTVTSVKLDPNTSTGTLECQTCHDPHNNQFTYFLRMSNANAALCTYCHNKTSYTTSIHSTSTLTFIPPVGTTTTIGSRSCVNCHKPHTALGNNLLRGVEQNTCYDSGCHGDTVTGRTATPATNNIQLDMGKARAHPTNAFSGLHKNRPAGETPAELSDGIPSARHAECQDCHNPHQAQRAVEKSVRGAIRISAALKGMWGVQPSWPAPPTGAALTTNAVAFTTDASITYTRLAASAVTDEYQVCMKCHSGYVTLLAGARNIAKEINPGNSSYHGMVPGGQTNYHVNTTTMVQPWGGTAIFVANTGTLAAPLTGSTEYNRQNPTLVAAATATAYANRGRVWCSDCHGSDASTMPPAAATQAAPYGPHGSANNSIIGTPVGGTAGGSNSDRMLIRTIASASAGTPLCLACHKTASTQSGSTGSRFSRHGSASVGAAGGCFTCHMWENSATVTGGTGRIFPHGMNKRWATIGTSTAAGSLQMTDAFNGGWFTNINYSTAACNTTNNGTNPAGTPCGGRSGNYAPP